ncbi:hypothetical protein ACLQ3K_20065 [Tsukamurella sp. DT100]|uniref:hypothetical protein n=1 Tax=Tsukamurella sp. DT100 TaxID=3393415 RepID=UPI003CEAAEA9
MIIPLPFAAQHHAYASGVENEDGNTVPGHLDPVSVACIWWTPSSAEPATGPVSSDRVVADVVIAVDSALQLDSRDYFTIAELMDPNGDPMRLDVVGMPKDYDHGPFGFAPGRRIVELKAVNG